MGTHERVSAGVFTTATRLYVRRVASMPPGLDVPSPQLADKHRGYTDLRPICGVRFGGPSNGTRHAVHGANGSHSCV